MSTSPFLQSIPEQYAGATLQHKIPSLLFEQALSALIAQHLLASQLLN
jgi:hypothetical protein